MAFPCNQFGAQEPGTWEEIASFADRQYGVTFPIMGKVGGGLGWVGFGPGWDGVSHGRVEEEKSHFAFLVFLSSTIKDAMQQGRMGSGWLRPDKRMRGAGLHGDKRDEYIGGQMG